MGAACDALHLTVLKRRVGRAPYAPPSPSGGRSPSVTPHPGTRLPRVTCRPPTTRTGRRSSSRTGPPGPERTTCPRCAQSLGRRPRPRIRQRHPCSRASGADPASRCNCRLAAAIGQPVSFRNRHGHRAGRRLHRLLLAHRHQAAVAASNGRRAAPPQRRSSPGRRCPTRFSRHGTASGIAPVARGSHQR
jgi:hypothetical protein